MKISQKVRMQDHGGRMSCPWVMFPAPISQDPSFSRLLWGVGFASHQGFSLAWGYSCRRVSQQWEVVCLRRWGWGNIVGLGLGGVLAPSPVLIQETPHSRAPGFSPESCLSHLLSLMGPFSLAL